MKVLFLADFDNNSVINGGYGSAISNIKFCLEKLKKDKNIKILKFVDFKNIESIEKEYFDFAFLIANPNSLNKNYDLLNYILQNCDNRLLHILWETDIFPSSWEWLWKSDLFTGFFTPSNFLYNMIKKVTDKDIYYTPYCMIDFPEPIDINIKKDEESFTILYMGQITKRKGIEDTICAYIRNFQGKENNKSQLLLKCFRVSKYEEEIENTIIKLTELNSYPKNLNNLKIFVLDDNLDKDSIYDLMRKSSVLLFPSRGEGFGLPVMEAMSLGLPIIYTDWSATPEIVNPKKTLDANWPIEYVLDESVDMVPYNYEIGSKYAIPLCSCIMDGLQTMYEHWIEDKIGYYKLYQNNIDVIKQNYNLENSIKYYKEIIFTKN